MTSTTDFSNYPDALLTDAERARITELWNRVRTALEPVVEEMQITNDELKRAGLYFNRLGQSGMFPSLLIVALGMISLRVTESSEGATLQHVEGPFFEPTAPVRPDGNLLEHEPGSTARRLRLTGRVLDFGTQAPLPEAVIDFWQADENGNYDNSGTTFHLRGKIVPDKNGAYCLKTIVPKDYAEHDQDPIGELFRAMSRTNRRAAHIHVKLACEGYQPLTTQLFMPDADHLEDDYLEGAVMPELMLAYEGTDGDGTLQTRFDFRLVPTDAA